MTCTELDEEILMDKEYRRKIATGEAGRIARGVRPELPEQPLSLGKVLSILMGLKRIVTIRLEVVDI